MAEWSVFASKIKLIKHPGAERLMIAKVGNYSLVVGIDNGYCDDDIVVLAPDKSILPDEIKGNYVNSDTGISYLTGTEHNRVKRIRLRGEDSDGVTINKVWVLKKLGLAHESEIPLDVDLSEQLGITKYEPVISYSMGGTLGGNLVSMPDISFQRHHDCEKFRLYLNDFEEGEPVFATEKIHGSQISIMKSVNNTWYVTSKGIGHKQLAIQESEDNLYWKAFNNSGIKEIVEHMHSLFEVQIFGEVIPVQKGYSYGQTKPALRIFRMMIDNRDLNIMDIIGYDEVFEKLFVPIIYEGPFNEQKLIELSKGMETIGGGKHIREGIVVSPKIPRKSKEGFWLYLKIINPKYLESGEEIS